MGPLTIVSGEASGVARALSNTGDGARQQPDPECFDPKKLEATSLAGPIIEYLLSHPRRVMNVLRAITPILTIPLFRWSIVLRYDEVREVLESDRAFPVGWGAKMIEVTGGEDHGGKNFVLGMPRCKAYRLSYAQLAKAFPRCDVQKRVAGPAVELTRKILEELAGSKKHEFDAVQDLITAVPTHLCESYYGIVIPDKVLFANWTLATSAYVFGPSTPEPRAQQARAAAACLRKAIRDSIALAKSGNGIGIVLPRMLRMGLADDVIHAQLFGMVLGFIPTNVLAGGNILETLLRRPDFLATTRAAALAGDDDLLWRCLREALRFRHINPAPWRSCPKGYTFSTGCRIPAGNKVLAIIQSAMFDPLRIERSDVFDPERRDEDYMVFGVGQHWCLGAFIAKSLLTQTFKPLLKLEHLRAVRNPGVRTKRFNDLFPLHLTVGFGK